MQGTSPFAYQSPSFHSSSYLPKMEASFMRDFSCCGLILPSLHELLQHYEEQHAQSEAAVALRQRQNLSQMPSSSNGKVAIDTEAVRGQDRPQQGRQRMDSYNTGQETKILSSSSRPVTPRMTVPLHPTMTGPAPSHEMDAVQDMEMDDLMIQPSTSIPQQYGLHSQPRMMQRSQFGQPPSLRLPPLDIDSLNMGSQTAYQGLRNSQPTTPINSGRRCNMFHNNPTVSSVNTPTLSAHPLHHQQQYLNTPDSSAPGTPGELSSDLVGDYNNLAMLSNQQNQYQNYGVYGSGGNEPLDLYIDEPAKRLFSPDGGFKPPKQQPSSKLDVGQYTEDSELARTIREQQRIAGVTEHQVEGAVPKPFHCPVIGCEKAYKNHNGLKYHKSVRHPFQVN